MTSFPFRSVRLLCAFVGLVLVFAACKSDRSSPPAASKGGKPGARGPVSLEAMVATPAAIELVARLPGSLAGARNVELKTEIAGRVAELGFKEGSAIKQGALLLRLSDDDLSAVVSRSQAKVKLSQITVTRKRQQLAADGTSKQDVDASEADLASNEADLALAQAQLRKASILAPFSGVIGIRSVELGQTVAAGQSVATLSKQEPWRIVFSIPEELAGYAEVGQELSFRSGASRDSFPARIVALDPVLDEATRTRKAVAQSQARAASLFPGGAVDIKLTLHRTKGISVPTEALSFDAKGPLVWIYREGKSVQTRIATGIRTSDRVEARSGLKVGDTVLVVGAANLKPNGEVKIARIRETP